jgi:hypothetical protein
MRTCLNPVEFHANLFAAHADGLLLPRDEQLAATEICLFEQVSRIADSLALAPPCILSASDTMAYAQITLKRVEVRGIAEPVLCGEMYPEDHRRSVCASGWTLASGQPECIWSLAYPTRDPLPMSDGLRALMEVGANSTARDVTTECRRRDHSHKPFNASHA